MPISLFLLPFQADFSRRGICFPEFFRSLSLKLLCLRARDRGLHLVRVRAFCAAPVESRGHVKVVLPRLHAAVCIRGAHNQCGVDLAVRTPRNRSAVHVVTADSARTASAPRELHLMLRSCRSAALRREGHRERSALSRGKRQRE